MKERDIIYINNFYDRADHIQIQQGTDRSVQNAADESDGGVYIRERAKHIRQYFIKTTPYTRALELLAKNNIVLLVGNSGTGKSSASFMLSSEIGTDCKMSFIEGVDKGNDEISNLVGSLRRNYAQKEIIVFDDFLGKTTLNKDRGYLTAVEKLFELIKDNPNKKLIINSRITIVESVIREHFSIASYLKDEICKVDFNKLTTLEEKCELFALYVKKYGMVQEISSSVSAKNLKKIVEHENYAPLILDRAIKKCSEDDSKDYARIILYQLDHPEFMWAKEIEALNQYSKEYLYILYSMSDSFVKKQYVDKSFIFYLENQGIPYQENLEKTVGRLKPLIQYNDAEQITFEHPSVIDCIKKYMSEQDRKNIVCGALYFEQLERLGEKEEIRKLFDDPNHFFKLKVLPVSFTNSSFGFVNSIFIKYLKYMKELDVRVDEELVQEILNSIFRLGRLLLLHSANIVIDTLALDYDFSGILNNEEYMYMLYDYTDYDSLCKLISLTSKQNGDVLDFEKLDSYIQRTIEEKIYEEASYRVNSYIRDCFMEELEDYLDRLDDDQEFYYEDVAQELIEEIIEAVDMNDIIENIIDEINKSYKLKNLKEISGGEIEIDYHSAEEWVRERCEN